MRRATMGIVVGLMLIVAAPATAQTELQPIDREPADAAGHVAAIELVVPRGEFSAHWLDLQRVAARHGGTVAAADAGTADRNGQLLSFGTAEIRVPNDRFGDLLGDLIGTGTFADGTITSASRPESVIQLTLTESIGLVEPVDDAESMLGSALNTAARVILTIVSVVIVVAAAVLPIAILAVIGYAIWRWVRRQVPPPLPAEDDVEPDPEPVAS